MLRTDLKFFDKRVFIEKPTALAWTGIQWKALPKEYGAASSVHKYFLEWTEASFFEEI